MLRLTASRSDPDARDTIAAKREIGELRTKTKVLIVIFMIRIEKDSISHIYIKELAFQENTEKSKSKGKADQVAG